MKACRALSGLKLPRLPAILSTSPRPHPPPQLFKLKPARKRQRYPVDLQVKEKCAQAIYDARINDIGNRPRPPSAACRRAGGEFFAHGYSAADSSSSVS